MTLHSERSILP